MSDFDMMQDVAAVAEFGSMGAAARVRGRPQQYISRSVRKFESLVGVKLFERHNFGVTVTPQGRAAVILAGSAARIYQDILGLREQETKAGIRCAFAADILTWAHADSFRKACQSSGYAVSSLQSIGAATPNSALIFEKSDLLFCTEPDNAQEHCEFRPILFAEFDLDALRPPHPASPLIPKSLWRHVEALVEPQQTTVFSDLQAGRWIAKTTDAKCLEPVRYCLDDAANAIALEGPKPVRGAETLRISCGLYYRKVDASRFNIDAIGERMHRLFSDQYTACCKTASIVAL